MPIAPNAATPHAVAQAGGMRGAVRNFAVVFALVLLAACGEGLPTADTDPSADGAAPATSPASPATGAPQAAWTPFQLAGCTCSDGSPLTFFQRAGDPNRVVLYFEGGGACFSATTCDPDNPDKPYLPNQTVTAGELAERGGLFDFDHPENPIASHSWVFVPYCTGDVHLGDATTDYGDGVVIEHRGHANAMRALEHLVATFPDAQQVVVTGQSAGSVPTPQFAALTADLIPGADVVTFGDSSGAYPDVDVITEVIGTAWGAGNAIPDWPETAGISIADWSFPEQYVLAGKHAPEVRFGRFDFAFDEVQATFGALAGVAADDLITLIDGNELSIEEAGVAIASYVAPGTRHTIAAEDDLYTMEVDGVRLIDWLTELINDPLPPPDVHCERCT